MTYAELEQLWISNGGDPSMAPIMAAIAMAESSGNPQNINWNDPQGSFGLWQVNHYWNPQYSTSALLGGGYNAQAAQGILKSQGLGAWSTWNSYVAGAGHGYDVISQYLGPYTGAHPSGSSSTSAPAAASSSSSGSSTSTPGWLQNIEGIPILGKGAGDVISVGIVGAFALVFFMIGGAWLIFGNQQARTIVTNTGRTAAKAATAVAA